MVSELVVEAAVAALMSALANDVWPRARDRMSRALRPADPAGESAALDSLIADDGDEARRGEALKAYLMRMLREHPERVDDVHFGVGEVEQILIETGLVQVAAHTVNFYGQEARPSEAARLSFMQAGRAAHELEAMPEDGAILLIAAMTTEVAAKRLALMNNAAELLSNMDDQLAANLLAEMLPPFPAQLFCRMDPERGWVILTEMAGTATEAALTRLGELTELDPGRAALLLFKMSPAVAAQLLATLSPPHPAELFSRMGPDRAGAVLAAMNSDKAVWRVSEMPTERAAQVLSKMDRSAAVSLLKALKPSLCTDLLARMASGDAAEVLAKMEPAWACARLAEMPLPRTLDILVALRPPRSLVKEIDAELASRLLPAAIAALARWAKDMPLIESAQAHADRIRAEAEAEVNRMLTELPKLTAVATTPAPVAPPPPTVTLSDRIIEALHRRNRQTLSNLAKSLHVTEPQLRPEMARLVATGGVVESGSARSAVAHYSLPD